MRVTGYYTGVGGYMDAVQPDLNVNSDVNSGSKAGVRWAFRMEPDERWTITPRIFYQEVDMDGWNRIDDYNILANPFTTTRPAVDLGDRQPVHSDRRAVHRRILDRRPEYRIRLRRHGIDVDHLLHGS